MLRGIKGQGKSGRTNGPSAPPLLLAVPSPQHAPLSPDEARREFLDRARELAAEGAGAWWATPSERADWAEMSRECARTSDAPLLRLARQP